MDRYFHADAIRAVIEELRAESRSAWAMALATGNPRQDIDEGISRGLDRAIERLESMLA
jgi:hypothetical protein